MSKASNVQNAHAVDPWSDPSILRARLAEIEGSDRIADALDILERADCVLPMGSSEFQQGCVDRFAAEVREALTR